MIEVRTATPPEFADVGNLLVSVYSQLEGFPAPDKQPDYYRQMKNVGDWTTRPGVEIILAAEKDKVLAAVVFFADIREYGSGGCAPDAANAAGFRFLVVDPSARQRGLGTLLTDECIRRAKLAGRQWLLIHTTAAMQNAWRMYEKLGFKRARKYDFTQEDLQVFGFQYLLTNRFAPPLGRLITTYLAEKQISLNSITIEDLAPFDELHSRGRAATEELASLLDLQPTDSILDAGCGIGGTCRYIASRFRCPVTGVELNPEYVETAQFLNELVGLQDSVTILSGDATQLPASNQAFDAVVSQHSQMNIANKPQLVAELGRVLKRNGRYVFHEIFSQSHQAAPSNESATSSSASTHDEPLNLRYPLPWAMSPESSFLVSELDYRYLLNAAGFKITHWQDCTEASVEFLQARMQRLIEKDQVHPVDIILGGKLRDRMQNILRVLSDGALSVVLGKATKDES